MPTTVAAIDCGTNSVRLLIARRAADGSIEQVERQTTITRLGQGVDATGEFAPEALQRTFAAAQAYADEIAANGQVEAVHLVSTSAARDARNGQEFSDGIEQRLGVRPDVISGEQEARLSFAGATAGLASSSDPVLVIDIGGGSTELIRGRLDGVPVATVDQAASLDMGAVRVRERFLCDDPATLNQVARARAFVGDLLDGCPVDLEGIGTFVGVAGTVTTMAAAVQELPSYERDLVHGYVLDPDTVTITTNDWLGRSVESLRTIASMHPRRAEVISAGALILDEIVQRVGRRLVVSETDILDGIAAEMLAD